tara:strand:+ start:455 stop:931 length:477 start_codon:yes stop_codon:yes gene_type:complete
MTQSSSRQRMWHHSTINWILWLTLQNGLGKSMVILLTIIIQSFHKNKKKYISLETYKIDGGYVRTPVWFVIDSDVIYVVTQKTTGKVKRLQNNNYVRITSCSFKGEPTEWTKGKVKQVTGEKADNVIMLRKKKYGISARLIDLFSKENSIVFSIEPVN